MITEKLNRIYQGRVSQVTIENADGKTYVSPNGAEQLFEFHQLYQDAVNYYLVALAAMALPQEESLFGKLKIQLKNVWDDFSRNGTVRPGLKHSICRTLGHPELLNSAEAFEEAMRLILDGNTANPKILNDALEHIAKKCEGDVTQPAKTYFPQLCTKFNGNYDCDAKAFAEAAGHKRLLDALRAGNAVETIISLVPEMELGWCGIKTQTGKSFNGQEAQAELRKAVQFFIDDIKTSSAVKQYLQISGKASLDEYLRKTEGLTNISFGRNNKAEQNRRNAMWLLKFFPDRFTVGLMKSIISAKEKVELEDVPLWGDDPIKLSRKNRAGHVFSAFTSLPLWKEPWKEFDMAAFTDALKTINQFRGKTQERNDALNQYQKALAWMDGKSTDVKPPALPDAEEISEDAENESSLPVLAGDPRWDTLRQLLKDLGIQNEFTEGELVDYGISARTIRGFRKLRSKLLLIESDAQTKKLSAETILLKQQAEIDHFQEDNRDVMGSAVLFRKLAEPRFCCIWHDLPRPSKNASLDILRDAVRYYSYQEEVSRLQEPIQITPADARYSRRCCDFRALIYDKKGYKNGFGHRKDGTFAVQIAAKTEKKYGKCKAILTYSAPRLRRDGLIGGDFAHYYPPAVRALIDEAESDKQEFASTAVSLMPDWDKNGKMRILLNFATSLDVTKLNKQGDTRFEHQFMYAQDANIRLRWPSDAGKYPVTWCESGEQFSCVAVDLGQRTAGALSRLEVSTMPRPHAVKIGEAGGKTWYAFRRYSELLRLPGEDALVLRDGKRVREYSGAKGRYAEDTETEEAKNICNSLLADDTLLLDHAGKIPASFPQQNDRLLLALRRALAHLKQMHRWLWLMKSPDTQEKAQTEMAECLWLKDGDLLTEATRLRDELPKQLLKIADRVLPLRGRHWSWIKLDSGSYQLKQTKMNTADFHKKICGQRGLSFARLQQLEALRTRCQSLNRLMIRALGEAPATVAEMRKTELPDCCPDILMRLDAMKEQRVNQTANMILAQALGLRHKEHSIDSAKRLTDDVHGEYERIPGVQKASFVVLENLSRYRFSQDRSSFENSRLMKWSHRQILEKIKLLCEVFGIPVVEVNAAYSSKFSANGIPGFRSQECAPEELSAFPWNKVQDVRQNELLASIRGTLLKMREINPASTALMPRQGGPVFVPFIACDESDTLPQADINASFNIGLRAVADAVDLNLNNRLSAEYKKGEWCVKSKLKQLNGAKIGYSSEKKSTSGYGNFFVLGVPPFWMDHEEPQPHFSDAELNKCYPHLMFGSALWRDTFLQLKRCLKINEERLLRLQEKKKS